MLLVLLKPYIRRFIGTISDFKCYAPGEKKSTSSFICFDLIILVQWFNTFFDLKHRYQMYLSIYGSIFLSTSLSFYSSTILSIYEPIFLSTNISLYKSIYLRIYLPTHLPMSESIIVATNLSFHLWIYLSSYLRI